MARKPRQPGRPTPSPAVKSAPSPRFLGWRLWLARFALAIAAPVVLLLTAEAVLRLAGYGYPTSFCLWRSSDQIYTDNPSFLWQFYSRHTNLRPNPFSVSAIKPPGAVRIVVLGESAAAGTPEPAYSFSRILERMLRQLYPGRGIEVINAAMRGVNSHILLPAARDCLCLNPDLFLVYMGNNEAVGLHAPGPNSGRLTGHLSLLRTVQWIRSQRVGQLLAPLLQHLNAEGAAGQHQDEAFFLAHRLSADDPRRGAVYANFQANLSDLCETARRAGAGVALATIASNLKDCPPFGSLPRSGLSGPDLARWDAEYRQGAAAEASGELSTALAHYAAAAALDNHYAELRFRTARCQFALGQFDRARQEYQAARDWDALPLRGDSQLNRIVRERAASLTTNGVLLIDTEHALADSELSEHGIPGDRLFHDHVHPTFDGDYLLARAFLPAVLELLATKLGQPTAVPPQILSRSACAELLAFTRANEAQISAAVVKLTADPPFTGQLEHEQRQRRADEDLRRRFGNLSPKDFETAVATYRAAVRQAPDDWQLAYCFARLLLFLRDETGAVEQFERAERLMPYALPIRLGLSSALSSGGRYDEAIQQLRRARALDSESEQVQAGLAAVERQRFGRR